MKYGIEVKLINPEALEKLQALHGRFAAECYATKGGEGVMKKVGQSCENDGHWSGSRCEYIKFEITADRGTIEQICRSEIGTRYEPEDHYLFEDLLELNPRVSPDEIVKNMASFRYIDKDGFGYTTPFNIEKIDEANNRYCALMNYIDNERRAIKQILVDNGVADKKAVEDANLVLPRATITKLAVGFTPEALIRFENMRLCSRAQEYIHEVAVQIKKLVEEVNPEFSKQLVKNCDRLLWCPEKHSCGAAPTKDQLKAQLQILKDNNQGIYHKNMPVFDDSIV